MEVFWRDFRVIELFICWDDVSVQLVIFLGFYGIENKRGSNDTSDVIVQACDISGLLINLVLNGEVKVR